jgi:hypothetical protein
MSRVQEHSALRRADSRSPAHPILAYAQEQRFVIEEFSPLADSLEWSLGQRYLRERGSKAFISDAMPVPFVINNDSVLSRRAAQTFFASLVEAEKAGPLEARILVLELGIGVGLFARFFLDAFKELSAAHLKDYYRRLVYVAGDRSERMLADACRHGVLADHAGHYLVRVVDALEPGRYLADDPALRPPAGDGSAARERPQFRAVFLNYLLDCLPAADLKIAGEEVRQLYVRTCLARNVYLPEYTPLSPADLVRRARSGSAADQRTLLELYGLLASEYEYRVSERGQGSGDRGQKETGSDLPYLDFAVDFARGHTDHLLHNYGALQCLQGLLPLLHPSGFILINDYGQTQVTREGDFEHQRFSHATFVGINFPLLKAYFQGSGARGQGSGRVQGTGDRGQESVADKDDVPSVSPLAPHPSPLTWVEPKEDSGRIHSRLLGHGIGPETAAFFAEHFSKAAWDWTQQPWDAARANLQHGRVEGALSAYHQALERQPTNWLLMNEIANFLTFQLRNPLAGIAMARAALELNPACSAELWNTLGDAFFEAGKVPDAKNGYLRALRVNPSDVKARYNLAWVFTHERRYQAALKVIAEAFGLDETGEYYERLGKKQAEIFGRLGQRNQQKMFLLANRVSSKAGETGGMKNEERKTRNEQ